jgi:hypothetical protein
MQLWHDLQGYCTPGCVAEPNRLSCKSDMRLEFMIRLGILGGDLTAVTATV